MKAALRLQLALCLAGFHALTARCACVRQLAVQQRGKDGANSARTLAGSHAPVSVVCLCWRPELLHVGVGCLMIP